jgi:hypothetical protein
MAAAGPISKLPASAKCEEQRAELNAVLQSGSFSRAPTLAHLLSYLCEKLFAGEAGQIKEYSIGVEVFHRGSSFDQDSNSIVRVEANRLRKRLAQYYASEGAAHTLRIVIPIGQYVPEFVSASAANPVAALPGAAVELSAANALRRIAKDRRWIAGTILILALLGGLGYWRLAPKRPAAESSTAAAVAKGAATPAPLLGPPAGDEIRILAGESRGFVDHAGKLWSADRWYSGGTAVKSSAWRIARTQDPDLYRTSRQGEFRYDIPLQKGIYELRLHFAETVYGPGTGGGGGEGSRIMSVSVNGKTLLSHLDVVADAGAGSAADVKDFPDISPGADGQVHLSFAGVNGNQAMLSAIEILPGVSGRMRPVRVLARQTPYYSNDSEWWSPDDYFEGGQMASYTQAVSGTDDPELYESERWGNFSYAIPAPPGKYTILLHFAVRHGAWNTTDSGGSGAQIAHVFNVFCNGKVLLQNFNLPKEARQSDVVVRKAMGLEPNAQGKLLLSFVPVEGYATVTGIEVLPQ